MTKRFFRVSWQVCFAVLLAVVFAGSAAVNAATPRRIALVIGNAAYDPDIGVLANPVNDVTDLEQKLTKDLKFKVTLLRNATATEMKAAIAALGAELGPADVGLFFYGGHGVAVNGRNYLLPVDTPSTLIAGNDDELVGILDAKLIQLDDILTVLQKSKAGLAFLDSCRNAPGTEGRSGKVDFRVGTRAVPFLRGNIKSATSVATSAGTFRAYATDPGNVAQDGAGRNSPFAAALLKHIATPGETIDEIMRRVRAEVIKETKNHQTPWTEDLLIERFIFLPRSEVQQDLARRPSQADARSEPRTQRADPPARERRESSGGNSGGGRTLDKLPPGLGAGAGAGL